jgi:hypothetical protein
MTGLALNRALLARQLLLESSALSIESVVSQMCGLQMQYAPSAYIGLWSRMKTLQRRQLTEALADRTVVQATSLRATIHLMTPRDYVLFIGAIRRTRREWWKRATRHSGVAVLAAVPRLQDLLSDGPRRRSELVAELGIDSATWNGLQMWVDLVRVPPSGTWEHRRADSYGLASWWLGSEWSDDVSEPDAIDYLVTRYLHGFGPATRQEIASFTGLPVSTLKPSLERLPLRTFRSEDGQVLLDVEGALLPDPDTATPIRFLPVWDATLLVHARRTQILPERYRPLVFNTKTPHSVNTFLIGGQVAGTWTIEKDHVAVEPFEALPTRTRHQLDQAAAQLTEFVR